MLRKFIILYFLIQIKLKKLSIVRRRINPNFDNIKNLYFINIKQIRSWISIYICFVPVKRRNFSGIVTSASDIIIESLIELEDEEVMTQHS